MHLTSRVRRQQATHRRNSMNHRCCSKLSQRYQRNRDSQRWSCSHPPRKGIRRKEDHLLVRVSQECQVTKVHRFELTVREGPVTASLLVVLTPEQQGWSFCRRWEIHVVSARDLRDRLGWESHGEGFTDRSHPSIAFPILEATTRNHSRSEDEMRQTNESKSQRRERDCREGAIGL